MNIKKNSEILNDLKRYSFHYISHFITGNRVKVLINLKVRAAKFKYRKHLKIAFIIDFLRGTFCRRTYLLIQRANFLLFSCRETSKKELECWVFLIPRKRRCSDFVYIKREVHKIGGSKKGGYHVFLSLLTLSNVFFLEMLSV